MIKEGVQRVIRCIQGRNLIQAGTHKAREKKLTVMKK